MRNSKLKYTAQMLNWTGAGLAQHRSGGEFRLPVAVGERDSCRVNVRETCFFAIGRQAEGLRQKKEERKDEILRDILVCG